MGDRPAPPEVGCRSSRFQAPAASGALLAPAPASRAPPYDLGMALGLGSNGANVALDALLAAHTWIKLHVGDPGPAGTANPA